MNAKSAGSIALLLIATCSGCELFSPRPSLDKIAWTEGEPTRSLLERVRGTVLDPMTWEGDELHSFPDGASRAIDFPDNGNVHVSGPDADGWTAVLRTNGFWAGDRLELVQRDGSSRQLCKWSNMEPWPEVALSEHGQRVAVSFRIDRGGFDYTKRAIQIFDVPTGTTRTLDAEPGGSLVWVLDGRALAYVMYWHRGQDGQWHPGFNWQGYDPKVPPIERKLTVMLYSYDTGETRELCRGLAIAPANTQDRLLVQCDPSIFAVDVDTGEFIELGVAPGMFPNGLLGETPEGILVYDAWATREEGVEFPSFTMMGPAHTWTVKAFDPKSHEFCTLLPRVYHGRRDYRLPRDGEN